MSEGKSSFRAANKQHRGEVGTLKFLNFFFTVCIKISSSNKCYQLESKIQGVSYVSSIEAQYKLSHPIGKGQWDTLYHNKSTKRKHSYVNKRREELVKFSLDSRVSLHVLLVARQAVQALGVEQVALHRQQGHTTNDRVDRIT